MKWSSKDTLLLIGIMVAAIITTVAIIFKDDLSRYSSRLKITMPDKVSILPAIQKTKKVLVLFP